VGKWRELFESNLPPVEEREYGEQYTFGPPATPEELDAAERTLGVRLPADVRELLSEFNGVWYTTDISRERSGRPEIAYLDIHYMAVKVPEYFRSWGEEWRWLTEQLAKVVYVYQSNGFGDLFGVCAEDISAPRVCARGVAGVQAGEVVYLSHENTVLQRAYPNLREFVRRGPK